LAGGVTGAGCGRAGAGFGTGRTAVSQEASVAAASTTRTRRDFMTSSSISHVDTVREVEPGHLYVVATPIGNLRDLSPRAQAVLAGVNLIAAEDTRTSGVLTQQFGIRAPLRAFHEHNERELAAELVEALKRGQSIALISDAGTPLISDPGFSLVRAAREAGVPVIAIPGPCAAVAALSISGLPSDSFVFVGFLPPKSQARRARLQGLASENRTLILYEASHRIVGCVGDCVAVFGADRRLFLAREISKRFEQSLLDRGAAVLEWLTADENHQRGEFVLIVEGAPDTAAEAASSRRVLELLLRELPAARAAKLAAEITGARRDDLYGLAVTLSKRSAE
jgi:16S rRNA (cytidine1402-2'-O)-methyltransferase